MRVSYHRLAVRDGRQVLDHYEAEAGEHLADRFLESLLETVEKAVANPTRFPPAGKRLRRANLDGFPYHFLYEQELHGVRVLVVRHHRRHPQYGLRRH